MGLLLLRLQAALPLVGELVTASIDFTYTGNATPRPGERCQLCTRRVPKPRKSSSPTSKRIVVTLPPDRAESLDDALDGLQEVVGADAASYPRGTLLEAMVVIAGLHHREELIAFFTDYRDSLSAKPETSEGA